LAVDCTQAVNLPVCLSVLFATTMHCRQYTSVMVDILHVLSAGHRLRSVQHADLQLVGKHWSIKVCSLVHIRKCNKF